MIKQSVKEFMSSQSPHPNRPHWRDRLHEIIFEADTPAGKLFDVVLICSIVLSVTVVLLDSMVVVRARYGDLLYATEWFFTMQD